MQPDLGLLPVRRHILFGKVYEIFIACPREKSKTIQQKRQISLLTLHIFWRKKQFRGYAEMAF